MGSFIKTLSVFSILFSSLNAIGATECVQEVKFQFDDRAWEKGYENADKEASIIEYTLKGETVGNWNELVSVQKLIPISSVDAYYDVFMQKLNEAVAPEKAESRVISKNDDSILFEWWIEKGPEAQHEWFKLFRTPDSTLILRYTTKKLGDVEKVRGTWEKILNDATYTQSGECKKSPATADSKSLMSKSKKADKDDDDDDKHEDDDKHDDKDNHDDD